MTLQFDAASDELAVFLEEAEEQLQLLDQDVLVLEKEGPTADLLQEVFRAAHTLKGSSAAIGHERMASLTHGLESVLDYLRKGKIEKCTALIDLLFRSLDALRTLKEEVVTREHSGLDTSDLVQSLKGFLEQSPSIDSRPESVGASADVKIAPEGTRLENPGESANGQLYKVTVQVDEKSIFPAARLLQVYLALSDIGQITESQPSQEDIEGERVGQILMLRLITNVDGLALRDLVVAVPDIVAMRIEDSRNEAEVVLAEEDLFALRTLSHGSESLTKEGGRNGKANDAIPGVGEATTKGGEPRSVDRRPAGKTVRIDIERLDALMNLVGELVIDCTRLAQLSSRLQARHDGEELAQGVGETSEHIQRITDELQDKIMKARMFPVSSVFSKFPRIVRDLAQRVGKKVEFIVEGEKTEIDRSVIEEIGDPLTHLLRNAVDHGIEPPDERVASGKPEAGQIRLLACHRENRLVLTVEDDGRGIDPDKIRESAVAKGLCSSEAAARMSDREATELIFAPGFSTVKAVSDVSGRGVGMDIVRTNIRKLNGGVKVESSPGLGSQFVLELPLTLAVLDALLVSLDGSTFAIPLASVIETLRVHLPDVSSVNGHKVVLQRGQVLPLLDLADTLSLRRNGACSAISYVVVVSASEDQVGIIVDSLIGEQQIVVKSLGSYVGDIRGLSGATILGDGKVAMILDVPALVKKTVQERGGKTKYV